MLKFYTLSDELQTQLSKFRASHPYTQLEADGSLWKYIACGQGKEVLLLLPGAPGLGEIAFQQIEGFEQTYRVISVNYPTTITSAAQLMRGLAAILAVENIPRVHVEGGSYGGMVAQWLVRHYPDKIETLILSHIGVPTTKSAKAYNLCSKILSFLPLSLIYALMRLVKHAGLSELTTQQAFWSAFFDEAILSHSKEAFLNRTRLWVDLNRATFTCNELRHWPGRILIIEADNDPMVPLKAREALKALYPQAYIHTLHGTAHTTWFSRPEEFHYLVIDFLKNKTTVPYPIGN